MWVPANRSPSASLLQRSMLIRSNQAKRIKNFDFRTLLHCQRFAWLRVRGQSFWLSNCYCTWVLVLPQLNRLPMKPQQISTTRPSRPISDIPHLVNSWQKRRQTFDFRHVRKHIRAGHRYRKRHPHSGFLRCSLQTRKELDGNQENSASQTRARKKGAEKKATNASAKME